MPLMDASALKRPYVWRLIHSPLVWQMIATGKTCSAVGRILALSRIRTHRSADADPGFLVRLVPSAWKTVGLYLRLFRTQIPPSPGISHGLQDCLRPSLA